MNHPESDDLTACLAEIRTALLAGRIDQLTDLSARIERALEQRPRLRESSLSSLRSAAEGNRHLLDAALKGVRAAKRRAHDLTEEGRFSTYEQGGKRSQPGLLNSGPSIRL